jgi:hypothetical protein
MQPSLSAAFGNLIQDSAASLNRFLELMTSSKVQRWGSPKDSTMALTETRSLQQIKRETEQTRAGLADTVEQLRTTVTETASDIRERISPAAIKAEVSGYIRSRGEQLMDDVTAAARKNPMQAVAVGASIAFPLLRLVRAIPLPILMVGAGVFLANSKAGQAATQKASDVVSDLSDQMTRRARELGDQLGDSASVTKSLAKEKFERLSEAVAGASDQASRAASAAGATLASGSDQLRSTAVSMADRAADVKDQGVRAAGSAAETVKEAAGSAASLGQKVAGTARDTGLDSVRETATHLGDRAGKNVLDTIEQNPLLVAGVGLLIGGLIAGVLPRSDFEDELVGDTSSAVKRRAQAAATQGFDAARNAAGDAYDEAARQAQAEGIDADGLDKAARDIGQRVRRVAESAVTTAFEPPEQNHHSDVHGEHDHG